jgi:hypothetical protein
MFKAFSRWIKDCKQDHEVKSYLDAVNNKPQRVNSKALDQFMLDNETHCLDSAILEQEKRLEEIKQLKANLIKECRSGLDSGTFNGVYKSIPWYCPNSGVKIAMEYHVVGDKIQVSKQTIEDPCYSSSIGVCKQHEYSSMTKALQASAIDEFIVTGIYPSDSTIRFNTAIIK